MKEQEKQARLAPPLSSAEAATSSQAQPEVLLPPIEEESQDPPQGQDGEEEPEDQEEEEPQYMPLAEAKNCFFVPYDDNETLEEFGILRDSHCEVPGVSGPLHHVSEVREEPGGYR